MRKIISKFDKMKSPARSILYLTVFIFFGPPINYAQTRAIDSLFSTLKTQNSDTDKVKTLNELAWEFSMTSSYDSSLLFAKEALNKATRIAFKSEIAVSYSYIGNVYYYLGDYSEAVKNYSGSLKIKIEIGDKKGIATTYSNLGNVYYSQGNYPEALRNYLFSLKMGEQTRDKKAIAYSYNNIGIVYFDQGNYPEALKNYLYALRIFKETGDKNGIAYSSGNTGNVYGNQGNYPEALKSYFTALKIFEEAGDKKGIALSYNNIGTVYFDEAVAAEVNGIGIYKYSEALSSHLASLRISEEIGDDNGIAMSYNNIGLTKIRLRQYTGAKEYLDKGLALSKKIGAKEWIRDAHKHLSLLDSIRDNYKSALENYKSYIVYHDSLSNEENTKKTVQAQMQYEFDKKETLTKAAQEKKDLVSAEEKRKQQLVLRFTLFGLAAVIIIAVFIFRSLRVNKKKNKIITLQKEMVEKQKAIVEEKQKEILDSIYYARRIQRALITNEKYIGRKLKELGSYER